MGSPAQKLRTHTSTANFFLCGLRRLGQLSTRPVTRASTLQNSESTPRIWRSRCSALFTGQRLVGHQQHDEEDGRPEEGGWEGEDELRVGEEYEAGAGPGHGVRLGAAGGRLRSPT